MLQDSAGHLWIGTGNGISRYDGEHFTTFTTQDGLADNRVYCLLEDAAGSLWVGTEGGISRFDGEYFTNYTTADGLVHNRALSLLNDAAGSLWIGTLGGISRFDGEKFTNYTTADGLAHDRVSRLAKDWTGDLWIGTLGGISRFDGEKFTNYTTADGLVHNQIYDLLVDKAGHLWATTTGGLSQYDGILVSSFTVQDGLADNRLTKLALDHRGTLWIGTAAGLNRYDGEQFVHLATKDGLAHDWIHCLLVDKANHLWIGTLDGLSRYDGEKFTNYTTQNGLTNNNVRSLLEDKAGHLWIGTLAGLNRYDGKSFESFTTRDGLAHNAVTALLEEEQTDHLWIGTQGGGINRYNGFFFQELSSYDGLINDSVQNLLQDRNGAVWVATAGGLTRLLLRRTTPTIRLTNVVADRAYGPVQQIDLPSSQQYLVFEFGSGHFQMRPDAMLYRYRLEPHEAEWQTTRSGRVEYADLPRGAYTFEVQAIDQNLSYSEDSASVQVQVHLPYGQIALWTTLMLALGVAAWQARKVTLRNRKVRSVNAELSQSNEELQKARHELEQRVEQRTAQLAQRNEELARSNTDLRDFAYVASHDLQEPLRAIMNFGGLLHSRYSDNLDERGQDYLHRMRRAASRSQDLIQGLLAFSRVTQRTEPFVSVDLGEIVRDVVEDLEIRLQQSNGEIHWDDLPTIEADATQMRQLLQNLLHNAIKFRRPQEPPRIDVYAHPLTGTTANETIYELTVKDNGIGFDPKYADRIFTIFQRLHGRDEYEGTGVGLTICRKIAERHRGHIKADSTPGEGTTFTVTLPARQSKSPTAAQDPAADAQHTA
jgi:signal transduction histidine kinase/streptogramin lyase